MIWLVYDATGVIPILTRSARNHPQALVSVASNKSKGRPAHSKYNLCGLAAGGQRIEYGSLSGLTCPCAAAEIPRQNDNARKNRVAARHTQTKIRKPKRARVEGRVSRGGYFLSLLVPPYLTPEY